MQEGNYIILQKTIYLLNILTYKKLIVESLTFHHSHLFLSFINPLLLTIHYTISLTYHHFYHNYLSKWKWISENENMFFFSTGPIRFSMSSVLKFVTIWEIFGVLWSAILQIVWANSLVNFKVNTQSPKGLKQVVL